MKINVFFLAVFAALLNASIKEKTSAIANKANFSKSTWPHFAAGTIYLTNQVFLRSEHPFKVSDTGNYGFFPKLSLKSM